MRRCQVASASMFRGKGFESDVDASCAMSPSGTIESERGTTTGETEDARPRAALCDAELANQMLKRKNGAPLHCHVSFPHGEGQFFKRLVELRTDDSSKNSYGLSAIE